MNSSDWCRYKNFMARANMLVAGQRRAQTFYIQDAKTKNAQASAKSVTVFLFTFVALAFMWFADDVGAGAVTNGHISVQVNDE